MAEVSRRHVLEGLALALGGGGLARATAGSPTGRTDLVVGEGQDVTGFDPHMSTSGPDTHVSFNLYDTLVRRNPGGSLEPGLATAWELVSPTAWRFRLRSGVVFHDGDAFSAADARFSLERTYDPAAKTLVATALTTIERIETPDPLTLVVHTRRPDFLLPARLASYGGQILPKAYVERVGADGLSRRPVGTGPVRFIEWVKGDRVVLERVPGYWGGTIAPSRVIIRPVPDVGTRLAALLKGELDIMVALPPDHVERVARHPATKVVQVLYAGQHVLVVDSRRPPLDNPRIKQALSLAIDRETLVRELLRGQGIVPNGPIPQGESHHDPTRPPLPYDPALARQRLAEGGYRGEPVVLESTTGHYTDDRVMSEAVIAMFRDVGINARLELIEVSVRMQKIRQRSFKGLRWATPASPLADPDGMLWRLLAPGGTFDTWRHPRFDELGQAARDSVDERFRRRTYAEMTRIFLEHLPWIPVLQPRESYGVQRHVVWTPHPSAQLEVRRFNLELGAPTR